MADDLSAPTATPAENEPPKRGYRRPELRELGSLRELTQADPPVSPSGIDGASGYTNS